MKSRTDNTIRNTVVELIGQVTMILLTFIVRTIFIKFLDISYLGINGLFSNILSVLSFAELGFGTAITYALYKPIAKNDKLQIVLLMKFYKKVYKTVGSLVFLLGISLTPFLNFFINDIKKLPDNLPPIMLIYLLYLLNSVLSYFFNYKRTLIIASQNGYLNTINTVLFNIIQNILQAIVLIFWKNYILYLLIQIFCTLISNILISRKADILFPYLNIISDKKLSKEDLRPILKNVIGMSFHKFGAIIVNGTDNILISKFIGIKMAGVYSNYFLISNTIRYFYMRCFSAITASLGNLLIDKKGEEIYLYFKKIYFINMCIAVIFSNSLMTLLNSFISLLWGEKYTFNLVIVFCIVLNFYMTCMRQTFLIFIEADGLFWKLKWKAFWEAVINLVSSLFFIKIFNLEIKGIICGTILSNILTNFWWEPYILYKYTLLKEYTDYLKKYTYYFMIFIINIFISLYLEKEISNTIIGFIEKGIISFVVSSGSILILFRKTDEFYFLLNILNKIISRKK